MKLSDRGIQYEANSGNVITFATNINTTYRGNTYRIRQVTETIPQPTVQLTYRGVTSPANGLQKTARIQGRLNP